MTQLSEDPGFDWDEAARTAACKGAGCGWTVEVNDYTQARERFAHHVVGAHQRRVGTSGQALRERARLTALDAAPRECQERVAAMEVRLDALAVPAAPNAERLSRLVVAAGWDADRLAPHAPALEALALHLPDEWLLPVCELLRAVRREPS